MYNYKIMETIYLKINVSKSDTETDKIRDQGLFFENIADAVCIDRGSIVEIDEKNYLSDIDEIQNKYSK